MSRRSRLPGYVSRAIVGGGGGGTPPAGERDWGYIPTPSNAPITPSNDAYSGAYWLAVPKWYTTMTAYASSKVASPRSGQLAYVGEGQKTFLALALWGWYGGTPTPYGKVAIRHNGRTSKELQGISGSDPLFGGVGVEPQYQVYDYQGVHHTIATLQKGSYVDGVAGSLVTSPYVAGVTAFGMAIVELRGCYGAIQDLADGSDTATTWVKLPGTTASYLLNGFTQGADTRLTYTGSTTKRFRVDLVVGRSCGNPAWMGIYKNGTLVTGSSLYFASASYKSGARLHCFVELASNEYVEGWKINTAATFFRYGLIMTTAELGADYGLIHWTVDGAIPFSSGKIACTTALGPVVNNFSMPASNRLQYDGATTKKFLVTMDLQAQGSSGASYYYINVFIAKNGSAVSPATTAEVAVYSNGRITLHTQAILDLAPGDYVEAWGAAGASGCSAEGLILSAAEFA